MTNPTTALTRPPAQSNTLASITGSSRDPVRITEMLEQAAKVAHVLTPASSCPELPEGLSVATSAILVSDSELYEIPGGAKVGLAKTALDRIASALGVSWSSRESRRLDDGRDRHYCAYQAVGSVPLWDGSRAVVSASKEIDLRAGSPAAAAMSEKQLAGARLHILAMAESKAKNRAIRSLGVRPAYTRAEAKLPFVCARAIFTGQTSDPELRRTFAVMQAQAFLGAHTALYGRAPAVPQLPPGQPAPPVGQTLDHDEDGVIDASFVEDPEPAPTSPPVHTAPEPGPRSPPPSDRSPVPQTGGTGHAPAPRPQSWTAGNAAVVRFGRDEGRPISEVENLGWYASALQRDVDNPNKKQWLAANQRHLDEVLHEMARREGGGDADDGASSGGGGNFEAEGKAGGDDDDIPFATSAFQGGIHPRAARWERW